MKKKVPENTGKTTTVSKYIVTGTLVNGKRFEAIHTDNLIHALSINLYRGNVWEVDENGKRKVIRSVYN